ATRVTMLVTLPANTTARNRRSRSGRPSGIPSGNWPTGCWSRRSPTVHSCPQLNQNLPRKWTTQSSLPWLRRILHRKKWGRTSMPEVIQRELTFAQAIREALAEEMRRDATVCIMGEDVAEAGTPFKVLSGLVEEFGKDRVLDTPISEAGFTGMAV